ncbi:hypothetical protein HPB47_023862 [Ixodes persulcatus]|uniref:Uncharacterized protein n=1 Tax=Ixodes persulcatus TaxID=34615 RepID=A0AC60Q5R8_IXOPE|nr:hypothetical protein HPB47_023862 [Ixodes persulcatus]
MSATLARSHRRGGPDCAGDTRDLEVKRGPGEGRETKGVEWEKLAYKSLEAYDYFEPVRRDQHTVGHPSSPSPTAASLQEKAQVEPHLARPSSPPPTAATLQEEAQVEPHLGEELS